MWLKVQSDARGGWGGHTLTKRRAECLAIARRKVTVKYPHPHFVSFTGYFKYRFRNITHYQYELFPFQRLTPFHEKNTIFQSKQRPSELTVSILCVGFVILFAKMIICHFRQPFWYCNDKYFGFTNALFDSTRHRLHDINYDIGINKKAKKSLVSVLLT